MEKQNRFKKVTKEGWSALLSNFKYPTNGDDRAISSEWSQRDSVASWESLVVEFLARQPDLWRELLTATFNER